MNSKHHCFRLKPHEDLKQSITRFATEHGIKAGAVVSCAGSLAQFNIRFANQPEGTLKQGYFEIVSLSGTFNDTSSHIHISVSDNTGATIGGHLLDKNLIYTTAEIVVVELTDVEFTRETDPTYGYQELVVKKKK
ncbi:MAG TPA: PPC domain-containing DNA-binding protein [Cyclobacteriaceae bacterium]|nr:PPC domain-containing DNA-binding protein [Cyclobacteriaceae bacterium]